MEEILHFDVLDLIVYSITISLVGAYIGYKQTIQNNWDGNILDIVLIGGVLCIFSGFSFILIIPAIAVLILEVTIRPLEKKIKATEIAWKIKLFNFICWTVIFPTFLFVFFTSLIFYSELVNNKSYQFIRASDCNTIK